MSLMTLKKYFLKVGIYDFDDIEKIFSKGGYLCIYSSLHLDSTKASERKFGVRVGNGTLFKPFPRYDFEMGSVPLLKISSSPDQYKKEWEELIQNVTTERKKGKQATFTVSSKDIDLFKSGEDEKLTVKSKKDGIKNGKIIQIKLDSLKSLQDIFKRRSKIKMII